MEKERCQHSILIAVPSVKEQAIADIANRESINSYVERGTQQSHSYSLASARVHTKQTLPLPFQCTN